jgi:hypothetical protein
MFHRLKKGSARSAVILLFALAHHLRHQFVDSRAGRPEKLVVNGQWFGSKPSNGRSSTP